MLDVKTETVIALAAFKRELLALRDYAVRQAATSTDAIQKAANACGYLDSLNAWHYGQDLPREMLANIYRTAADTATTAVQCCNAAMLQCCACA